MPENRLFIRPAGRGAKAAISAALAECAPVDFLQKQVGAGSGAQNFNVRLKSR